MNKIELKALGKINLGLDVLGRRENGYHDVRMVMQTLYLYDQITITKKETPGIELKTNLFYLPVDENNEIHFSSNFACPDCGISIEEIEPRNFSFNNPFGACPSCAQWPPADAPAAHHPARTPR